MDRLQNEFGIWDYLVFASMLLISAGIGIYFATRGGKQKTQGEYLMANRSMSLIPVAISILVSFISAILILGTPAEMYTQGTEYSISVIGKVLGVAMAAVVFVPLLYPLQITSVFEYLELRFKSHSVRLMGSFLMIASQILYMGIACFAPSTAFEAITGFPVWATIMITGAVATFYTAIGGMKAVVWTDVFQGIVMLAGILAIVVQGALKVGGFERVWSINEKWERIKFFNFDPDPTVRHTVWSLVIGTALGNLGTYGVNQASVQRYSSLPTLRQAKMSVILNTIGVFVLVLATCVAGIVLFAYYADKGCDPLALNLVDNSNQLVPYFVMETLSYPGVPGLFVSSLFSGALSSVSSSLNALAAITWEDFLKPSWDKHWSESRKTAVTKFLVVVYGCLAMGVGFLAQQLEGTVLQASNTFIGSVYGPLTGMFLLAAFFPWANSYGAVTGAVCGLGVSMWLSVGTYVTGIPLVELPHPNGTCFNDDSTITTMVTATITSVTTSVMNITAGNTEKTGLEKFYSISYLWFNTVGIVIAVVVGLITSFITGANSMDDVPTKYQIQLFSRIRDCLPHKLTSCKCSKKLQDIRLGDSDTEKLLSSSSMDTSFNDDKKGKSVIEGEHTLLFTNSTTGQVRQLVYYGTLPGVSPDKGS